MPKMKRAPDVGPALLGPSKKAKPVKPAPPPSTSGGGAGSGWSDEKSSLGRPVPKGELRKFDLKPKFKQFERKKKLKKEF